MNRRVMGLKAALAAIVFFAVSITAMGQSRTNYIGQWYTEAVRTGSPYAANIFEPLGAQSSNPGVFTLQLNNNQLSSIIANAPAFLNLSVPYDNQTVTLNLAKVNVTSGEFSVNTDKGPVATTPGVFYRGIVNNNPEHIASVSFFNGDVIGFYSTAAGNFVIGKLEDASGDFCVYNEKALPTPSSFNCDQMEVPGASEEGPQNKTTGIGCKTVNIYYECDYALFQNKGSNTTNVVNYVTGLFNQVSTLYANENIAVQISQIFVWTTTDPYAGLTSTNSVLNSYTSAKGANFNGNLSHFLTTRSLGGGIAYVNVLCYKNYAHAVSQIYSTYSNVPTYSWSVEVVTHEMGHNIGSPHTQACSWAGGALDNCYTPEGSCPSGPAPSNGGTIMSYCHLTNYGINFNNGFGQQPGDLIRTRVLNAACIAGGSGVTPTGLSTSNITFGSAQLNWIPVVGASQYTVEYKLATASTWTYAGSTTNSSLSINGLSQNSIYVWHVKSDCSNNSADLAFTTLTNTNPGCNAPIQLTTSNITETAATLSWDPVIGAANYTVEYKTSTATTWTALNPVTTTSVNISSLTAGTTYNWRVKADCSVFGSAVSFTTLTPPPPPPPATGCTQPANLNAVNVTATSATLTWTAVASAQKYQIKYRKVGAKNYSNVNNVTGTSYTVTGLQGGSTYQWMINAQCGGNNQSGFTSDVTFNTMSNMVVENGTGSVNLYPNPATNVLNISVEGWSEAGTGEIYNLQGASVKSFTLNAGQNTIMLDGLANGMYVLQIRKDGQQTITRKFMKSGQ